MANNKLILRSVQSPWVTPFNDITTNSVLSWGDVDNNFIYLKGELIYSGFTSNNQLILQKINGSQITINGVGGFLTGYTNYYTTGATLNDTILSFDRTDELSAYEVNLSSLNYGNKWVISSGTTVEVKENYQSFIYGDLYIQGTLLLNDNAQLVVLNGDIILSGGSISGNGTTLLVDLPMVDTYITGGTYSNGDLTLVDNFGDDVTINGFYTGSTGNYLPLSGGVMDDNAIIEFNNTSQLREGYNDFGGQGGISQICGLGYENNWQAGINHIFDNNGFIRESKYCFNTIPDNTFDSSLKFKVGSRWVLDNGDVYICSDDTVGSAVWYLEDNDTYVTGGTYFSGGTIIFGYNTGGDFEVSGLTVDLTSQIDGLAETDEQTITLNLTTNKIELKETVAEATGGTRTFQGDFAISGGTLNLDTIGSGSPIINLGLDSSGFVVTGTTSIPFTGNTSGDCISDIYVSNVHSCSPLHINPNDEGNVYFGSTSGVTVDLTNHKLVVENLQITSGATDGYILTSDANGNIELTAPTDGFTYQIGQYVEEEGGVIFHSYKDGTNENYLVVAIDDQSTGTTWSNITNQLAGADSTWNGLENSLTITGQTGHTESAAQLCLEYVNSVCDTILVTYTLFGGEPVTVEVEGRGLTGGKYQYDFIDGVTNYTIIYDTFSGNWYVQPQNPMTTYLTTTENCPFGTYTLVEGGPFESFIVEAVNPKNDWYLPAIDELSLLWQNKFNVNRTLSGYSSFGSIPGATQIGYADYWSSTEYGGSIAWGFSAWGFGFSGGDAYANGKDDTGCVRAVRKFSI
jgi:hypothetical protein